MNSESEDLGIAVGITSFDKEGKKIAVFSTKHLQTKSATSWKDVQEKIDKSLKSIHEHLKIPAVLFILSTHFSKEIEISLEGKRMLCRGGNNGLQLVLDLQNGKLVPKVYNSETTVLTIPAKMELVILSKEDVKMLISDKCYEDLAIFKNLTCEELIECLWNISMETVRDRKRKLDGTNQHIIVRVKIGIDGTYRDLPVLREETFAELEKLIRITHRDNERILVEQFRVLDEDGMPVSNDTTLQGHLQEAQQEAKLVINLYIEFQQDYIKKN
jgi:hypothetical protein